MPEPPLDQYFNVRTLCCKNKFIIYVTFTLIKILTDISFIVVTIHLVASILFFNYKNVIFEK